MCTGRPEQNGIALQLGAGWLLCRLLELHKHGALLDHQATCTLPRSLSKHGMARDSR